MPPLSRPASPLLNGDVQQSGSFVNETCSSMPCSEWSSFNDLVDRSATKVDWSPEVNISLTWRAKEFQ